MPSFCRARRLRHGKRLNTRAKRTRSQKSKFPLLLIQCTQALSISWTVKGMLKNSVAGSVCALAENLKTFSAKTAEIERKWYLVDATNQVLGRVASKIAHRLRGKHKPEYTPHVD